MYGLLFCTYAYTNASVYDIHTMCIVQLGTVKHTKSDIIYSTNQHLNYNIKRLVAFGRSHTILNRAFVVLHYICNCSAIENGYLCGPCLYCAWVIFETRTNRLRLHVDEYSVRYSNICQFTFQSGQTIQTIPWQQSDASHNCFCRLCVSHFPRQWK